MLLDGLSGVFGSSCFIKFTVIRIAHNSLCKHVII